MKRSESIQLKCIVGTWMLLFWGGTVLGQESDSLPAPADTTTTAVPEAAVQERAALSDSLPAPTTSDTLPVAPVDSLGAAGVDDSLGNAAPDSLDTTMQDSLDTSGIDSLKKASSPESPERKSEQELSISSGKAMLYSAIIPGGGQFYNKKYWKIPIVYGGFVALGIAIDFNQGYYSEFVRELNYRGDGDPLTVPKYDEGQIPNNRIIEARNYYRRYRDMCIIGLGVMYGLNIVDAYVDAELSNFDISEDLSMRLSPSIQYDPVFASVGAGAAPGLSLTFAIK